MRLLSSLITVLFITGSTRCHIKLVFPPARQFALDFIPDIETNSSCGFQRPKNFSATTLIAGTKIKVSWYLAYPHKGGVKIEIIEEDNFRVVSSLTGSSYVHKNEYGVQSANVTLPETYTCESCVLRILREAPEWESNLFFQSCADVVIIPYPEGCRSRRNSESGNSEFGDRMYFSMPATDAASTIETTGAVVSEPFTNKVKVEASQQPNTAPCSSSESLSYKKCFERKCLNQGSCDATSGKCVCKRLYSGERCEIYVECLTDDDCNHGRCIVSSLVPYRKLVCYCQTGWCGMNCDQILINVIIYTSGGQQVDCQVSAESSVELRSSYTADHNYQTRVIRSGNYTLHWRFVDDDIEVVIEAKTLSWVGVGWRPLMLDRTCKKFPESILNQGEALESKSSEDSSKLSGGVKNRLHDQKSYRDNGRGVVLPDRQGASLTSEHKNMEGRRSRSVLYDEKRNFVAMDCSDIVVGSVRDGLYRVQDMYTRDRSSPQPDLFYLGSDSLTGAAGSQVDGMTTIVFRKKTQSQDQSDHEVKDETMSVIWAMGLDAGSDPRIFPSDASFLYDQDSTFYLEDTFKYHGFNPSRRGAVALNFFENSPSNTSSTCVTEKGHLKVPERCIHINEGFNCRMYLSWKFVVATNSIHFLFKYPSSSDQWFAFGFSKSPNMPNSDVIMSWTDSSGVPTIQDRWADEYAVPVVDEDFDIFDEKVEVLDGIVSLKFNRLRETNDVRDVVFSDTQCNYAMLASGPMTSNEEVLKHSITPLLTSKQICIHECSDEGTESVVFPGKVELQGETFIPALLDPTSRRYKLLKARIEELLTQAYSSLNLDYLRRVRIDVQSFAAGSIIVSYIVAAVFDPQLTQSLASSVEVNLTAELDDYIQKNNLPGSSYFVAVLTGGRADDGGEEVEITLEKNHTFQSMAVYFFSLVGLVVAIELAKRQIQKRHHKHMVGNQPTSSEKLGDGLDSKYSDISANEIYEKIYDVMQKRHSSMFSRRVSNASDLRHLEDVASRHKPPVEDLPSRPTKERRASEFPSDRRFSMMGRPNSAQSYPRPHSLLERRPQSAKRFESKTSIHELMNDYISAQ